MSKAQGQFTIIDYNDAITLTGYIGSSKAKSQMYNPDNASYNPSWAASPYQVLTPSLFVAGSGTDVIQSSAVQSVTWYDGSTAITAGTNYAINATTHALTIKKNVLTPSTPAKDYRCVIVYRDPTTNLDLTYSMGVTMNLVVNGGGIVDLVVTTPNGNVFKNGAVDYLTAHAELWRGSVVDTSNVSYKWAITDPSVTSTSSTGYDADFGIGWRKLSNSTGHVEGATTATLKLYADQVDSYATVKCIATDTDSASNTYNQKFQDTASFVDQSDPIQVLIQSSGGDIFKNGEGSSTLTARVYRGGEEIDTSGAGTYKWYKYDKTGALVTGWGGSGVDYKTGKTLAVGGSDVDVKATFLVEVEIS